MPPLRDDKKDDKKATEVKPPVVEKVQASEVRRIHQVRQVAMRRGSPDAPVAGPRQLVRRETLPGLNASPGMPSVRSSAPSQLEKLRASIINRAGELVPSLTPVPLTDETLMVWAFNYAEGRDGKFAAKDFVEAAAKVLVFLSSV